jgi:hypothetical protein
MLKSQQSSWGSIPATSDTVKSDGQRLKECYKNTLKNIEKIPLLKQNKITSCWNTKLNPDAAWARINLPSKTISVFRVREVLTRIRNRESMPLEYGSGPGSCSFLQWLSRWEQKIGFFPNLHLHQSSEITSY